MAANQEPPEREIAGYGRLRGASDCRELVRMWDMARPGRHGANPRCHVARKPAPVLHDKEARMRMRGGLRCPPDLFRLAAE